MAASQAQAKPNASAESLGLRLSAMDLNSEALPAVQTTAKTEPSNGGGERDVFYDDDGLALDNLGFESVVVVDNLPIVGHESARKLESDVRAIFGGVGVIKRDGFSMPVNLRTLETLGHCFVEFNTRQEAELAMKSINGYKYENYRLAVTFYEDLYKPDHTTLDFEPYFSERRDDDGSESESNSSEDDI